ncbi:hypothetical protein ELI20_01140 [Rhizobium ruizarguesonis]|jgi:hypothetical protein|uniref:hypothetical protein n=1 Tax=Rhizobium TaxID=379 RepID=UPI00102F49E6|nr:MULTISPECIES: hypothetical protein [Rhizobium]QIO58722.1 hypothetical protein HA463_13940 [Rhizobium leguminosarum bv. trifolii]TAU77941.1 hypothetical protein ELI46_18610 [Rhizobium ruizarguesonis]TAW19922.1 hypothetical protein ELI20_01140 [Rhizobium ruizarguesonis]TBC33798.1 hypothetical protein ELH33_01110 [Rhizobium ruizarguesonis]
MSDKDFFDRKVTILMKEWDYLQTHIARFDTISFSIRQWSATIFSAFLGGSIALKNPQGMLIAIVPVLLLWLMDGVWKSIQLRLIDRNVEIQIFLASKEFEDAHTNLSMDSFVTPTMFQGFRKTTWPAKTLNVLRSAVVRSVLLSHFAILLCCLASYIFLSRWLPGHECIFQFAEMPS